MKSFVDDGILIISLFIYSQNNYELRSELDNSKFDLKESKGYLSEVQGQIKKEKRERAQ